jgi:hypothetical protein
MPKKAKKVYIRISLTNETKEPKTVKTTYGGKTNMKVSRREKVALSRMDMEALAERIIGVEKGEITAGTMPRQSLTVKLDAELIEGIKSYAKRAKTTMTAIVEILLWSAIEQMDALDGTNVKEFQTELDLQPAKVQAAVKKALKAVKK